MTTDTLTLYYYSTGEEVRELTAEETTDYLQMIEADWTHTGAVPGAPFGVSGTVYAA